MRDSGSETTSSRLALAGNEDVVVVVVVVIDSPCEAMVVIEVLGINEGGLDESQGSLVFYKRLIGVKGLNRVFEFVEVVEVLK